VLSLVAPSSVSTLGNEIVFFEGSFKLSNVSVTTVGCAFVQNTTTVVTALNYTDTGIACSSPTGYQSGANDTFVYITVNGKQYTNALPFEFYGKIIFYV
jgi:hypothetical protein